MTWATRRQSQYLSGFFGIILVILFIFLYPIIFKKPTCIDGKQNGVEVGRDCGGICSRMCLFQISNPISLWSRAFHVVGNTYNLVAFVNNQNKNSGVENAPYVFRVYDVNNRMIGRIEGSTFIPPNKQFAVFSSRFDAGESKVKSVVFEFTENLNWVKKEPTLDNLPVFVDNISMGDDIKSPRLSARIKNESIYDLPAFDLIAILYDADSNAINVSKTFKEGLASGDAITVYFTWPKSLTSTPIIKDVLFSINPFSVSF